MLQSGRPFTVFCGDPFAPVRNGQGVIVGNSGCDYNADGHNYDRPDIPAASVTLMAARILITWRVCLRDQISRLPHWDRTARWGAMRSVGQAMRMSTWHSPSRSSCNSLRAMPRTCSSVSRPSTCSTASTLANRRGASRVRLSAGPRRCTQDAACSWECEWSFNFQAYSEPGEPTLASRDWLLRKAIFGSDKGCPRLAPGLGTHPIYSCR